MKKHALLCLLLTAILAASVLPAPARAEFFPALSAPNCTTLERTLAAMGVDQEALVDQIPTACDVLYPTEVPVFPDHGYDDVILFAEGSNIGYSLELIDGVWTVTQEELQDALKTSHQYDAIFYVGNDSFEYHNDSLTAAYIDSYTLSYIVETGFSLGFSVDGDLVIADYGLDGYLQKYKVLGSAVSVTYRTDYTLAQAQVSVDGTTYLWTPEDGWTLGKTNAPCSAPAGYADYNESTFRALCPPKLQMTAQELAALPAARPVPALPEVNRLYRDLSEINLDLSQVFADLPTSDGVIWMDGLPVLYDNGYDQAAVSSYTVLSDMLPMTLKNGCWRLNEDSQDASLFRNGYGSQIIIGDWEYLFDKGALYIARLKGRMYTYAKTGLTYVEYHTGEAQVAGLYESSGALKRYTMVLDLLPETYIDVNADDQIINITYYKDGIYEWAPGTGWTYTSWASDAQPTPCDAPAGHECITEEWLAQHVKPQVNIGPAEAPQAPETYQNILPEDLTALEDEAFLNADLTDCFLPDGVTAIGAKAFKGCTSLVYVRIPASVTSISADAFEGCRKVVLVVTEGSTAHTFAKDHGLAWAAE